MITLDPRMTSLEAGWQSASSPKVISPDQWGSGWDKFISWILSFLRLETETIEVSLEKEEKLESCQDDAWSTPVTRTGRPATFGCKRKAAGSTSASALCSLPVIPQAFQWWCLFLTPEALFPELTIRWRLRGVLMSPLNGFQASKQNTISVPLLFWGRSGFSFYTTTFPYEIKLYLYIERVPQSQGLY